MSDSASLSGVSAALYINQNIKLAVCFGSCHRLTNDNLQSLQSEILIDGSLLIVISPFQVQDILFAIDFFFFFCQFRNILLR